MTNADRPQLAKLLMILGETFNEPVSDLRAEGYAEGLADLDIESIAAAVQLALRTSKFFPRPAELRELALGTTQDMAAIAWSEVLREIRRVGYMGIPDLDSQTLDAVRCLWGTWERLCRTLPGDGPELLGWMKQFQAAYQATTATERREELISRSEAKAIVDTLMPKGLPNRWH